MFSVVREMNRSLPEGLRVNLDKVSPEEVLADMLPAMPGFLKYLTQSTGAKVLDIFGGDQTMMAKFAMAGKPLMKKDLGMICMIYGNIYVATVAMGANPNQTVKAFAEADAYNGPSIIVAYSHCIAHGINMTKGLTAQKDAVQSGHFPLYRHNPDLVKEGKNPLTLDSKPPVLKYSEAVMKENRFRVLTKTYPDNAKRLMAEADKLVAARNDLYQKLAGLPPCSDEIQQPPQPAVDVKPQG